MIVHISLKGCDDSTEFNITVTDAELAFLEALAITSQEASECMCQPTIHVWRKHKTFVTFGQDHRHEINGKIFDKGCVAVIESEGPKEGREKAFELFGRQFCFEYPEGHFDQTSMRYFPRGFIEAN